MGQEPTTVNRTLGTVETIINGAAMKVLAPVTDRFIKSIPQLSFLNIWPLSALVTAGLNWVFNQLSIVMQMTGVKIVITIQTDVEEKACEEAEGELRAALLTGDKDAIAKASDKSDAAFGGLIHWDGSAAVIK